MRHYVAYFHGGPLDGQERRVWGKRARLSVVVPRELTAYHADADVEPTATLDHEIGLYHLRGQPFRWRLEYWYEPPKPRRAWPLVEGVL